MWECNKCGSCCRIAGFVIKEWDRGGGACKMLKDDNTCSIYETRPEICRVKKDIYSDKQLNDACDNVRRIEKERISYV